ncbi:hypothetical protein AALO_G00233240 [Alosa alosa]|uniref:Uncharacterized protein n=1 Tax=Alosa alosa TaxID=278164 RepID=A0AAV6FXV1_9TELE|nr:hypothetical protein AALO_G00233240 [Alosa alosa]
MMSTNSQELLELAVLAALNAFAWSHHAQVHLALIPVPALKLVKRMKGTTKRVEVHSTPSEEQKKRMWLKKDFGGISGPGVTFVFDKRLLKDLQKMALFKRTGPLELS